MKKLSPSRVQFLIFVFVVSLGFFLAFLQSNATDSYSLLIPTDQFSAVQNIQQVHLNPEAKDGKPITHADKIGIMNSGGAVLGIGVVEERDGQERVFTLKNQGTVQSSVIAGSGNVNLSDQPSSIIVGGVGNEISNGDASVILGGKSNVLSSSNSVILSSSGVKIDGEGSFAASVVSGQVLGAYSSAYAGKNIVISADGSLAMGSHIRLDQPGVFAFNVKNTYLSGTKPHTFVIKSDRGMIVGTDSSIFSGIQLTVSGAIRVGQESCSPEKKGAIIAKGCSSPAGKSCLCFCTGNGSESISISSDGACIQACKSPSSAADCNETIACGSRAMEYEATETDWRQFSDFCANGEVVNGVEPSFPGVGTEVKWKCGTKDCSAKRKNISPACNKCGLKGFPYCFDVTFDPKSPECGGTSAYKCTGADPVNAVLVSGDDAGLTADTPKKLVANNTAAKCEYVCKTGYSYKNGTCVKNDVPVDGHCGTAVNSCSAGTFQDVVDTASWQKWNCLGKDGGSSVSCMLCKSGYTLQNGACVKQESYHWECKEVEETHVVPKTCLEEDHSSIGIGPVHIRGKDSLPTHHFKGWVKDWLTYHRSDYLLDWTNTTPILYIPISYYVGSNSQSATVDLTMDIISNDVWVFHKNVKGSFSVKLRTNADGSNTGNYISVEIGKNSLKYGNFALADIPCSSSDSCTINVTAAKIDIPPMSVLCNESSTVLIKKLVCISSYTNQEAFGCLAPTTEEINSCYPPEQCEINTSNISDFIRDIRVSNSFRGLFYPEEGRYKVGQLIPFTVNSVWNEFGLGGWDPWTGNKRGFYSMCIGKNVIDEKPLDKNGREAGFLQNLE